MSHLVVSLPLQVTARLAVSLKFSLALKFSLIFSGNLARLAMLVVSASMFLPEGNKAEAALKHLHAVL